MSDVALTLRFHVSVTPLPRGLMLLKFTGPHGMCSASVIDTEKRTLISVHSDQPIRVKVFDRPAHRAAGGTT